MKVKTKLNVKKGIVLPKILFQVNKTVSHIAQSNNSVKLQNIDKK